MKFQGVLFDLDGTLLDTAADLGNALNHVLQVHQRPAVPFDAYRSEASNGAKGLLQLGFGEHFAQLDYAHARQLLLDHYHANICVDTRLFDGVEACLRSLDQQQIPWGIVTNKPGWLTDKLLGHFPALADCGCIVSGDTFAHSKPHPLPLLKAAEQLGLDAPQTLYVGDARRDIDAAHAANMVSVAALYGYINDPREAQDWQARFEISHISELLDLNA